MADLDSQETAKFNTGVDNQAESSLISYIDQTIV